MAATKRPIQKPSDSDILFGLNEALQIFLQGSDFGTALRQCLVIVSKLTNSTTTFLLNTEKQPSDKQLSIEGVFMLVWEEEDYVSLPFEYSRLYSVKEQNDKKWLKSLLAGERIIGYDKKFSIDWQNVYDQLNLHISSFMLFPLMINGQIEAILGFSTETPNYKWSDTQLIAMSTFVATFANALARQKAEEQVRYQRDYFFNLIDNVPSAIFTKDKRGKLALVNKAMADLYKLPKKDLIGKTDLELGHSQTDVDAFLKVDQQVLEYGKKVRTAENKFIDADDQLHVLTTIKTPLFDKNGKINEVLGLTFDITDQKLIEARLNESHRFRKHLTSLLPDCILLIDLPSRTVVFSNHTHFMGYEIPLKHNTVQHLTDFLRPKDNKQDWEEYLNALHKNPDRHIHSRAYQMAHHETNQSCWISELSRVFKRDSRGKVLQYLVVLQDITAARIALKEEAKAKKRYQDFIRYSIEGIYYVSCQPGVSIDLPIEEQVDLYYQYAVVEECNESMAKMYGLKRPEDFIGLPVYDLHNGESWEQNRQSTVELIQAGYRVEDSETIEVGQDEIERHFINRGVGVIEDNKFVGLWGVQQEISEKRRTEKALLDSELRLNNIVEAASIGLWEYDFPQDRMFYNNQFSKLLDLPPSEENASISSEEYFQHVHEEDAPLIVEVYKKHFDAKDEFYEIEFRIKSGEEWKWMYKRGRVVSWTSTGEALLVRGTLMDIDSRKRAELQLRQNEALLNSLFNNSSLGIKFIDPNEIIFQTNQRYCDIMQVSPEGVIGQNAFQFNLPEHRPAMRELLHDAIAAGKEELIFEKQFIRSDHHVVWARVTLHIVRKEDQSLKYIIALLEDITGKRENQQALRESKELLEAALQTLPDLKFRMDMQGLILEIYATEHDLSFFGLPSDQVIGKKLDTLLPLFAAQGVLHNAKATHLQDEVQKVALLVPNPEGVQHYEARMNAINEDEVIVVVRDVTENMLTEQELYETIHKMELSNRKLQAYIDSNLQLENFAYIASHDLREPVRTMRTFAQIIDKRYREKLDEDGRTYLDFVINSAEQMNQLIMDLLAYSRINSEETENVDIKIGELLRDIVSNLSQSINENQVEIETDNLPNIIQGSPTKLKQLFQNLIVNAIKFRHPDRAPVVRITAKPMTNHWQFSVIDNGIGIKSEFFEIIFALFKRLHNRRDYQGTGLGLAICKKIVEQHGGEIWVESEIDQGATFSFTLRK